MSGLVGMQSEELRASEEGSGHSISALAGGGFVMSWRRDSGGIVAQQFDADGIAVGDRIAVSPDITTTCVAGLASGGFVVTWISDGLVNGQIYDSSGTAVGAEFVVADEAYRVSGVFALPSGGFVVSWTDEGDHSRDSDFNLHAQFFSATGDEVGPETVVNDYPRGYHLFPAGVALDSGRFVLVWEDFESRPEDRVYSIGVQMFEADGTPVGDDFLANTILIDSQTSPDIAALPGGGFVVVWNSLHPGSDEPGDLPGWRAKYQIFDGDGAKVGEERLASAVGDETTGVKVSALPSGGFLVAWENYPPPSFEEGEIRAQLFDSDGNKAGAAFDVNSIAVALGARPDLTTLASGDIAVAWLNFDPEADEEDRGIKFQILDLPSLGTSGADRLPGTDGNDHLAGLAGADDMGGGGGNDRVDGGAGADAMAGGDGDDFYIVDVAGDSIVELAGQGIDTARSRVSYRLADHVENLILGGGGRIDATGNGQANGLTGNNAANRLDGAAGADVMAGGKGHDFYLVDEAGDRVVELGRGGIDTVQASISYTLPVHVEKLILSGSLAVIGRGNAAANTITGNDIANVLSGGRGADRIDGGGGNDQIFGGAGNDVLSGGSGGDLFYFNLAPPGGGFDRILDFSGGADTIWLDGAGFSGGGPNGTLAASAFHAGATAADAGDRILYDAATGHIFYDPDGSGAAAAMLFAAVAAGTPLSHADFVIY